jgi:hypothetical protein
MLTIDARHRTDQDYCSPKSIGYRPADVVSVADSTTFSSSSASTANGLTAVMVLHPIACGVSFIAFLLSIGAGVIGSLLGALVAAVAWIITLVVMAVDFTLFGIIRDHVNNDGSGSTASYSVGMWCVLAAMVLLFFGMFIVLFTCFSARRAKKRGFKTEPDYANNGYAADGVTHTTHTRTARRKRFGLF